MSTVLVTGSAGFIGSHLVKQLLRQGYSVVGLGDKAPPAGAPQYPFEICNLLDAERLSTVLASHAPSLIVHLAARTDLDETRRLERYAANIEGVENLVAAIQRTPSVRRCIYTSTQLVCRMGYVPAHDEDYQPTTLYGQSKVQTERIVRDLDGGGVVWCIVRPTTIWGPGVREHYRRFLRMIDRGLYFYVGRRPLYKSYGYVGNTAFQYVKLLEAPSERIHRRTFYLADYEPIRLRDWTNAFQRALGAPPIRGCPEWVARFAARVGDLIAAVGFSGFPFTSFRLNNVLTEYRFDTDALREICGPLPFTMAQGVEETVRWLRSVSRRHAERT